jgi:hypothetical protein
MNRRRKTLGAVASVLVLALGLSACGGGSDTSAAGGGDTSTGGGASSSTGDLTQASFVTTVTDAQDKARTSHVTMTIDAGGKAVTAEADVEVGTTVADTSMAMTMDMGEADLGGQAPGTIQIRLVDEKFYINMGSMTQDMFMESDLSDPDDPIAKQFSTLTAQLDPSQQLASFGQAIQSFTKKGDPRELDGVQTQPYEMVLDTEKVAGFTGLTAGAGLPKTLTYTIFVGPDDLPRRMSADIAGGSITVDYSQWGEEVDIEAPPADQISDIDPKTLGAGA